MKNLLFSLFISIFTILNTIPIQISAKEEFSNQSIIQLVSDIKIWKYKTINGHIYINDFGIVLESVGKLIEFHVNDVVFHLFHKK